MTDPTTDALGYCGLACGACVHKCSPACRGGGGMKDCYHRTCCVEKGIEGCWECEKFPCNNGSFAESGDTAFRGVVIGSLLCIQRYGPEEYLRRVAERMGTTVDYGDYRYLDPEEVRHRLCDG